MVLCANMTMSRILKQFGVLYLESLAIWRAEGDPRKKKFISDNRLRDIKQRMLKKQEQLIK